MIVRPADTTTAYQVMLKTINGGLMQGNEAFLVKLGLANQQPVRGDIVESQRQGF